MTTREERRARRKELRRRMAQARAELGARVGAHPLVRRARLRRRVRRLLAASVLVLAALLARCDCDEPPAVPPPAPPVEPVPPAKLAEKPRLPAAPAPPAPTGTISSLQRPSYDLERKAPLTWVDDFRMQVAARSPRLAACFQGVERPGALRWTAAVNPEAGSVSDHELEPVGGTSDLDREQRACLVEALSMPPYRLSRGLDAAEARSTPTRVGIVIEF